MNIEEKNNQNENSFRLTFQRKLRILREKKEIQDNKRITQRQASIDMGLSENALRNYENKRLPNVFGLMKIKKYYNVSYEYLLGETDDPSPNNKTDENKKAISEIKKILHDLDN